MKTNSFTSKLHSGLLSVVLCGTVAASSWAADRVKANNTTALNAVGSWVGGVVPTAADLAIFDNTLDGTVSSYALGGNVTCGGISYRDALAAQTITATAGSTLTLANGSAGIDLSSTATTDFTVGCLVSLGTSGGQTFNVFDNARKLTMSGVISGTGPLTKTGNGLLKLSASHTYTGGTVVRAGTLQLGSHNTLGPGNVTVQSGATLDLNGFGLTNKANYVIHIAGTGVGGVGALVDNAGSQLNYALTNLVLDADASLGGAYRFDMRPVTSSALAPSMDLGGHTLTKVGGNTFFLQQLSSVTDGNIVIQSGTLGLNGIVLTGSGKSMTVKNGGTLLLFRNATASTVSTVTCPITLEAGAVVSYTGTETTDAIDQSVGAPITLTGDATISQGGGAGSVFELAGAISGAFGLTKLGAQTLLLSGPSTYSGDTTVSAGTLALSSAWSGSGAVTVYDSASLEGRPAAPNATAQLNALTLGNAGNTTLTCNLGGFANPTNAVLNVTNALTLNGITVVNLSGTTGLSGGTFKLLTFGSLQGSGGFQMGLSPGFTASLATNGNSLLVTLAPLALAWRGATGGVALGDWVTTSPEIYTNWLNMLANAPAAYADGNAVVFNDSLTGTPLVNIPAAVAPASVTVSNAVAGYTFSGTGKISGSGGLTKTGTGTLLLSLTNDYSGATTIAQGTLKLGIADAIPSGSFSPAVTVNGTLDLNGNNETLVGLSGTGTVDNTAASAPVTLTLTGAGSFAGTIQNSGSSDSGALGLKKTGAQVQVLTGTNTFSGGILLQGALQVGSDQALGSGQIWLSYVGSLASDSTAPHTFTNSLKLDGGNTTSLGNVANNGVLTFSGPVTLNGNTRTLSVNSDVIFNGGVDNGGLTKQGNGTLTMNGVNTYTGTTLVQAGTLMGTGTFAGLVQISSGATLSPGTGIGTMTITSNLFLAAGSKIHLELNAASHTCDSVQGLNKVTYNGTLEVTNLAGTLAAGQSFQLFSAPTVAGSFTVTNLPALTPGLAWNWDAPSGTLSVVTAMATTPTNLTFSVTGGTNVSLSWPASHLGWYAQSNSVNVADTNYWFDIAGSETLTNVSYPVDPSLPHVFYRLRMP